MHLADGVYSRTQIVEQVKTIGVGLGSQADRCTLIVNSTKVDSDIFDRLLAKINMAIIIEILPNRTFDLLRLDWTSRWVHRDHNGRDIRVQQAVVGAISEAVDAVETGIRRVTEVAISIEG